MTWMAVYHFTRKSASPYAELFDFRQPPYCVPFGGGSEHFHFENALMGYAASIARANEE
jgi:hypothetical protein